MAENDRAASDRAEPRSDAAIETMSFEQALKELETIVRSLESGSAELDDAIRSYERGAALKRHCETKLREAQAKVEKITQTPDGAVSSEPAESS